MRKLAIAFGGMIVFLVTGCATDGGAETRSRGARRSATVVIARPAAPATRPVAVAAVPQQPPAAGKGVAERSATPPAKAPVAPRSPGRRKADGLASYYAQRYHGRRTASGERFDVRKMTAAHRTLPFGTQVRVTSEANGRSVVVRVNDRGPFVAGRVIDLSPAAARQLDMIRAGIVPVRMEVLGTLGAGATRVASGL